MSIGKFVTGFVVGGVVGAVIGILLAPQSGDETREMLGENAKDLSRKAQTTVREIQDKADDALYHVQKKGEEIIDKIQGLINKQKEESV